MTAQFIQEELSSVANSEKAVFLQKFFKTGKNQYAEGDVFLGIIVPVSRNIARANRKTPLNELQILLNSPYHEARLVALMILVEQFKKAGEETREMIFSFYLRNTSHINNWDLVDLSCVSIVGSHLLNKDRSVLYQMAGSTLLWDQRIAIVSTLAFIREREFEDTLDIARKLLSHPHDLIHKATGWMLREVGKRSLDTLIGFLEENATRMPRTALRYSIEHLSGQDREYFMKKRDV